MEPRFGWLWNEISPPISYQPLVITSPSLVVAAGNAGIGSAECPEQAGLIALGDADPGIVDLNFDLYAGVAQRALFDQNINIAMFGKLDGIAHRLVMICCRRRGSPIILSGTSF